MPIMKVLSFGKHRTCSSINTQKDTGFSYYEYKQGEAHTAHTDNTFCLIFVLDGMISAQIEHGKTEQVKAGNFFLIPQYAKNHMMAEQNGSALILFWNLQVRVCETMVDASTVQPFPQGMICVPMIDPLKQMLRSMVRYIKDHIDCTHVHMVKQMELLFILQKYYDRDLMIRLFSPSFGSRSHFMSTVLKYYKEVSSMQELAEKCGCSDRTFNRKFHDYFAMTPYQWIQQKKSEEISHYLRDSNVSFNTIAKKMCFSSPSHLSLYCRKTFGKTPTEMRKELQSKPPKK